MFGLLATNYFGMHKAVKSVAFILENSVGSAVQSSFLLFRIDLITFYILLGIVFEKYILSAQLVWFSFLFTQ